MRDQLAEIIEQVATGGKTFVVTKFGKQKALVVSIDRLPEFQAKAESEAERQKRAEKILGQLNGIWKDRKDVTDSNEYVKQLRQARHDKIFNRH